MSAPIRAVLGLAVVIVLVAAVGVGMGSAPTSPDPAPSAADVAAAKQRLASASPTVRKGAEEFEQEGCDACHAIAATGAKGKLGPRLDTLADDSVKDDIESIVEPRKEIVEGYEPHLMPTDYGRRIGTDDVQAIARFLKTVSGKGDD